MPLFGIILLDIVFVLSITIFSLKYVFKEEVNESLKWLIISNLILLTDATFTAIDFASLGLNYLLPIVNTFLITSSIVLLLIGIIKLLR